MKKVFVVGFMMCAMISVSSASEDVLDPADLTVQGVYQVSSNWSTLKRGWNVLILRVLDSQNQPVSSAKVIVKYDMATMPMNPPDKPVIEKEDGIYEKSIFLGMKGNWKFDISIAEESQNDTLSKTINIVK